MLIFCIKVCNTEIQGTHKIKDCTIGICVTKENEKNEKVTKSAVKILGQINNPQFSIYLSVS